MMSFNELQQVGSVKEKQDRYCHQAPDRAVVTGREESESERECETTPFVFSNSQFIQHIQICVST